MKATTYYHAASGQYANRGSAFSIAGVQYGSNWLDMVSEQEIEAIGLVPVTTVESVPENYREYNRTEELVGAERRVTWTRKPQEEIDASRRANALAEIARLEEIQLRESLRMQRESELEAAEKYALDNLGLTPEQLYAAASQPGAPIAMLTYKRMKDIDNAINAQREKL